MSMECIEVNNHKESDDEYEKLSYGQQLLVDRLLEQYYMQLNGVNVSELRTRKCERKECGSL